MVLNSPFYFFVLGVLCGVVGFRIGWRMPGRAALPITQGLLGFAVFVLAWRARGPVAAALTELGWAVGGSLIALYVFRGAADLDRRVWRGAEYRRQMLEWLRTGDGPEKRPLATARAHVVELAVYLVAAAATANLVAMIFGASLLNYMNAYVARLLDAASDRSTVIRLGWNSWSLIRVVAYVLLGTAVAGPTMSLLGLPAPTTELTWLAILGAVGVVLDLVLKLALSPRCGRSLGSAVDWEHPAVAESSDPSA